MHSTQSAPPRPPPPDTMDSTRKASDHVTRSYGLSGAVPGINRAELDPATIGRSVLAGPAA